MKSVVRRLTILIGAASCALALTGQAREIHTDAEKTYEIDVSRLKKTEQSQLKARQIAMAPGMNALYIRTLDQGVEVEYHLIGPFGVPHAGALDIISTSLDGIDRIRQKRFIECKFGRCLTYYNMIQARDKPHAVEASLLFETAGHRYHFSATVSTPSLLEGNVFKPEAQGVAQRELDLLLSLVRFRDG